MIGQIVGNYKIEAKLGEGGMGAVYKGVDTMLDREVAIKALRPELASQTSVVERFRSEAVTLAKLNHPNVATLYTMFRQGDELYMVLEFVSGETLDNILQRRGALPAEEAIPVFCQVLDGIDHAHEFGIVHRDIKPANMMLTEKGTLKVLDFGIARLLGSARMTRAGNIIGTLEYMAPEQVKGQETDGRSDIYALGMMLYEVLTGKLPFDTENEFELMKLQTEEMPAPPRSINPAIPEEVETAIMTAIQKDPDERFQTAGEMRDMLLEAGFGAHGTIHGATGTHPRLSTKPSRPAISQPGSVSKDEVKATRLGAATAAPPSKPAVKETRLGANAAAATTSNAPAMKATRLGVAEADPKTATQPQTAAANAKSNESFFSKLTWIHYAGAGIAAVFVLGVLTIIPLVLLAGSSTNESSSKPPEKPAAIEVKEQKPEVVAPPAAAPAVVENNVQSQSPPAEIKPLAPEQPALTVQQPADKPAQKPAQRDTVAQKPAAPAPPKKTAPPKNTGKKSLDDVLSGN